MYYCENNASAWTPWIDRGIAPCFLDTISSMFFTTLMFTFGVGQLVMYCRHGSPIEDNLKPRSKLYGLQFLLHLVLILTPVVTLALLYYRVIGQLLGHQVLKNVSQICVWILATILLSYERTYDIPSPPTRGHGALLLAFWALEFLLDNLALVSFNSNLWWFKLHNHEDQVKLGIYAFQYTCILTIFIIGLRAPGLPTLEQRHQFAYRTLNDAESGRQPNRPGSSFKGVYKRIRIVLPYVWPKGSPTLQLRVVACVLILIVGRVVNLYLPIYQKWIVESLTPPAGQAELKFRWDLILIYVGLLLAQGGALAGGLLSLCRTFLWIRVQQYTTREVQIHLYKHLHGLSLRWHLSRKTGEVLRIMDRGTNSINQLLSYMLFNIGPTVADIIIAISYLTSYFNAWFGLIVFVTMATYLVVTFYITEWRTRFRRVMNQLDNEAEARAVDSLLNFETVKYYNAEDYEINRYRDAVVRFQAAEWKSSASLSLLNFIQLFVITGGLLVGSLLCAYLVVNRENGLTVGDYVLFAGYMIQLYGPLNWLGTYYRMIQTAFIDMENMLDLLNKTPEIVDRPCALPLLVSNGKIEFNNVCFHYVPERPVLKNVSFIVEPGRTVALVGPSGAGKSTIIRLLFRLYDVNSGFISFDGQDISSVTQKSLRKHIGVVPQDTVLFNDTIMYNVRYGRVAATDDDVIKATQAAEIHERILSFPDQYDTVVGERGLKLSGGEKQRVAIARTLLKSPEFILLDEATSALDTKTERMIQTSLEKICIGRTTVIVAHRLSTVIHADEIIVLQQGEIVERGNHETLLELGGVYSRMWGEQQQKLNREDGHATNAGDGPAAEEELEPSKRVDSAALLHQNERLGD